MARPGDVVTALFPGAHRTKWRPGLVVSTDLYHATRPDVIVAPFTTRVTKATGPTDYILQDWASAGLHLASAFRVYFAMLGPGDIHVIGHLSDRDWQEVQARLRLALAVT